MLHTHLLYRSINKKYMGIGKERVANMLESYGIQLLAGADDSWSLRNFLTNMGDTLGDWFGLAVVILGLVAIAYAIWQITTGLMSHGKKPTNWGVAIVLLIVGGALVAPGGFNFIKGIAESGQSTIDDIGGQSIFMLKQMFTTYLP